MASVNKVILVGNLGADPEGRFLPSGEAVTNLRIATTETWKDKSGEKQERTEWHSVALFGRLAEIASEYLKKGRSVYIEGRLRTRKWQDKEGHDRYTTEVVASEMQMLGSPGERGERTAGFDREERAGVGASAGGGSAGAGAGGSGGGSARPSARPARKTDDPLDDDIPF